MKKSLLQLNPTRILIRSTNWIGDAVMTLPAVRTIRSNFTEARISILAQPWVADLFNASPQVDDVILYHKKTRHKGIKGLFLLARELRKYRFEMAILLQNAFEAALLARLAGIPAVAGFSRDGRRLLLSHAARISKEIRKKHQVYYYQDLLRQLGLACGPNTLYLDLHEGVRTTARTMAAQFTKPLIGFNPGASYGPAKRWPQEKYAALAKRLKEEVSGTILVFGTDADGQAAAAIGKEAANVIDLTGKTQLAAAMALIECCDVFVTNDSGLMHVAAAAGTPLVAIFGSTDAVATGPFSKKAVVIQKELPCIPCLKPECSRDFRCMDDIAVEDVIAAVKSLLIKP
ncbi:MAG: lipopolysaccharide heptosyltransferase II [Deltaproteobacteria bacterium]